MKDHKSKHQISEQEQEAIDACLVLGRHFWLEYITSSLGMAAMLLLPNNEARWRSYELFQFGFCGRVLNCPNDETTEDDRDELWERFLKSADGDVVLDGPPYPETLELVLTTAKSFFFLGIQRGEKLVREL